MNLPRSLDGNDVELECGVVLITRVVSRYILADDSDRNLICSLMEATQKKARNSMEATIFCFWRKVDLTTKLTTYWLDVLGRPWTMRRQKPRIQGQFGQPWTTLDSAPSAPKPQVAGSIPVPPAREALNSWGLLPRGPSTMCVR